MVVCNNLQTYHHDGYKVLKYFHCRHDKRVSKESNQVFVVEDDSDSSSSVSQESSDIALVQPSRHLGMTDRDQIGMIDSNAKSLDTISTSDLYRLVQCRLGILYSG